MSGTEAMYEIKDIINRGDQNGNGMVVRFRMPSGLEIVGLPTRNFYGGHWDLGPTWNYLVLADRPFLVDAGRFGQGERLISMVEASGVNPADLAFVLISHGHEDHDGGLGDLVKETRTRVRAHGIYKLLIRRYPEAAPEGPKNRFPAKCWHCFMPESFYATYCLDYHRVLEKVEIDPVDEANDLLPGIRTVHLPGHSPDCLAVIIGDEALLVGDIVLPGITPWPTREEMYRKVAPVLQPHYRDAASFFGLTCYIRSLKRLGAVISQCNDPALFPAHRIYYNGRWNPMNPGSRIEELIRHHVKRCGAILEILIGGPKTAEQIAREHFPGELLEGFGRLMAANEIISHCELLTRCGDVALTGDGRYAATGTKRFEDYVDGLHSHAGDGAPLSG